MSASNWQVSKFSDIREALTARRIGLVQGLDLESAQVWVLPSASGGAFIPEAKQAVLAASEVGIEAGYYTGAGPQWYLTEGIEDFAKWPPVLIVLSAAKKIAEKAIVDYLTRLMGHLKLRPDSQCTFYLWKGDSVIGYQGPASELPEVLKSISGLDSE